MSSKKKSVTAKEKTTPKKKAKPKSIAKLIAEAKPKKSKHPGSENLVHWQKGQSGNPLGAKAHNPELKVIKNLTEKELIDVANLVIKGNLGELLAIRESDEATILQKMLASVCVRVMKKGDMQALDVLLNRMIGKVKDKVQVNNIGTTQSRVVVTIPSNGKEAKV